MNELDAMLTAIITNPREDTGWLALADWLDENDGDPYRGELLQLRRALLATCCEPDAYPERAAWQSRMVELLIYGVAPCAPHKTLTLPGDVPMTFAFIPPGSFLMGTNHAEGYDNEVPVHLVTLTKAFFLGVHPVTQAQWNAVMGGNPSYFKGSNRPVEMVSWNDCQEFCERLSASQQPRLKVSLPTEAEWEWACRAGTTTEFHFGDTITTKLVNYNGEYTEAGCSKGKYREETTGVGSFPGNPWGLFDMHGNVWEWCQDAYSQNFYQTSPTHDPICNESQDNIFCIRGGAWHNSPTVCRAACRRCDRPDHRNGSVGCRVCVRVE